MDFETGKIELSLNSAQTGRRLTANIYIVTFDDGSSREMTMAELVMALCLKGATEKENTVVDIMETMAQTTSNIEALADIEAQLVAQLPNYDLSAVTGSWTITYKNSSGKTVTETLTDAALVLACFDITVDPLKGESTIANIEAKLDELNTQSQEQLITLQSETSKRDQRYEMVTNVIKSIFTVLGGNANNL